MSKKKFTSEDDELLADLGVEVKEEKAAYRTPREERIIAGFEEIQRFVDEHGHPPRHGEKYDIFERLYATRLDSLSAQGDCRQLLEPLDHQSLLAAGSDKPSPEVDDLNDDELLAELGVSDEVEGITELKHVRTAAEKRAAEEIANRETCEDFEVFEPLFSQVQKDLDDGIRSTQRIRKDAGFLKTDINAGRFFIVGGQMAYIASVGETFKTSTDSVDARLRVIYANGTESNLLRRSLQRAIYKDETSRMITESDAGPLFASVAEDDDLASGTIYVLRSKSDHPAIKDNRELIHKIGVTGGSVARRIANAKTDATYLLADVEVVATYELYNINRSKLENLFHRFFEVARLDIQIDDRFGNPVKPREWFLVPLFVIDEVVERVRDGSISKYSYDSASAKLSLDSQI